MDVLNPIVAVTGRVRLFQITPRGHATCIDRTLLPGKWEPLTDWQHNDVLYDWAAIGARLLTQGLSGYRIGGLYLEYKNVASPSDTVAPPAFDRSGGIGYYNALASSPNIDYLRVPLVAASFDSSDAIKFPNGNRCSFFAMSQGTVGVHGKAFSDVNNSKVYGGALVAIPSLADATQDIVFSRFYLSSGEQQVKLPTSQLGLSWQLVLE